MPIKPGHETGNHNLSPTKQGLEPKVEAAQRDGQGHRWKMQKHKVLPLSGLPWERSQVIGLPPSPHSPAPAFTTQRHPCAGVRRTEFEGHDSLGGWKYSRGAKYPEANGSAHPAAAPTLPKNKMVEACSKQTYHTTQREAKGELQTESRVCIKIWLNIRGKPIVWKKDSKLNDWRKESTGKWICGFLQPT